MNRSDSALFHGNRPSMRRDTPDRGNKIVPLCNFAYVGQMVRSLDHVLFLPLISRALPPVILITIDCFGILIPVPPIDLTPVNTSQSSTPTPLRTNTSSSLIKRQLISRQHPPIIKLIKMRPDPMMSHCDHRQPPIPFPYLFKVPSLLRFMCA